MTRRCSPLRVSPQRRRKALAVAPQDIRDLQGRAAHGALRRSAEARGGRGSRSSGLVAEQTLEQATCR